MLALYTGILEQLGDVQLVALDIATQRLHMTYQANKPNKKTRRTRGSGWSKVRRKSDLAVKNMLEMRRPARGHFLPTASSNHNRK